MRNIDRCVGLADLQTRAAELTRRVTELNRRMHTFVAPPPPRAPWWERDGIGQARPATREELANEMLDEMSELLAERERIRRRLLELDPALLAGSN